MLSKCTDPQRWGTVTESSFLGAQAEAYILHLRECPFHAEAENRSMEKLGSIVEIIKGTQEKGLLVLPSAEVARIREILIRCRKISRNARIKVLTIRVNGAEKAVVDLSQENRATIGVNETERISVWKSKEGDEQEDLYLTSYYLPPLSEMKNRISRHSVTLEGGQIINFKVESKDGSSALITLDYLEPNRSRVIKLAIERVKDRLATTWQVLTWQVALRQFAAVSLLVIAVIIVLKLLPGIRQSEKVTLDREQKPEIATQAPGIGPSEPPSNSAQQKKSDIPTTLSSRVETPSSPPKTKRRKPESLIGARRPETQPSTEIVHRIYISSKFDPDWRQALADSFNSHGVTLVESTEGADAILEARPLRARRLDIELMTPTRETLWWMSVKNSEDGSTNVKDIAQKIVEGLLGKLESIKRTNVQQPRR